VTAFATMVLAHQQALLRSALRGVLEGSRSVTVVAETIDVDGTIRAARRHRPDLVLVPFDLPGKGGGVGVCRTLVESDASCRVLLLGEQEDHHQLLQALEAGSLGVVTADHPLSHLLGSVESALRGQAAIPRNALGALLGELIEQRRADDEVRRRYERLTRRERQVIGLLVKGLDQDRIAEELVLSPMTVRTHIQNVLGKLEVHSRLEAVELITRHQLADGG
jgi:DNA-binding NarL/FixJ family response regulator